MEHHMAIEKDLLDQLLAGRDPKDVFNKDGLVDELKKALSERILNTELDEHLEGDSAEGKVEPPQWLFEEVRPDRHLKDDACGAAGSGRHFRPQADRQVPAPVSGFRQQDYLDVCARDDGSGDPRPSRGTLWHRGFTGLDLGGH